MTAAGFRFTLVERSNGPVFEDGSKAGWLNLMADGQEKPLLTQWLCPVKPDVWAALNAAVAGENA